MVKSIRIKKTDKWKDVDRSLISSLEFKCIDDGHMVNISDPVAREMIEKGWVINIDPMKEVKSPRKVMEVVHKRPDFVNPGLEETDDTGGTEDIPPKRPDEKAEPDKKSGQGAKKRRKAKKAPNRTGANKTGTGAKR